MAERVRPIPQHCTTGQRSFTFFSFPFVLLPQRKQQEQRQHLDLRVKARAAQNMSRNKQERKMGVRRGERGNDINKNKKVKTG